MLHTPLCDLLGIQFPVIQAAMGPVTSADLVAAVSNAGGLGSLGAVERSPAELRHEIARTRGLTDRPFAVNFILSRSDEEQFTVALEARPPVMTFALGAPDDRVQRARDAGIRVLHQVHSVRQARQAAEHGVDAIIAQGGEAGGNCGNVGALALIPQVVDAVSPIPVVAAGGIADGRGLAAALLLGAQGINIGTRFLASVEARCGESWKQAVLAAQSEDAVKVEFWNDIFPRGGEGSYDAVPRALRTPFIDRCQRDLERIAADADELRSEILTAVRQGRMHEYVPLGGQTAGMIHDVLPAAEIVRQLVATATSALRQAARLAGAPAMDAAPPLAGPMPG